MQGQKQNDAWLKLKVVQYAQDNNNNNSKAARVLCDGETCA